MTPELIAYARVLEALHKLWMPHIGQVEVGRALFRDGCKRVFLRWGRQTGKTQLMAYFAVRWCLTHPNAQVFIIGPFLNQARNIFLFSNVVANKCPPEYLANIHQADSRIHFTNGAHIKILGADNTEAIRGLTADMVLCDEVKDFPDGVWPVIYPTLLARRAPLIIAGTPPGSPESTYWDILRDAEQDSSFKIFWLTSYDNPYLAKEDIDAEKRRYERRGDLDTWLREYLAQYAPDSKRSVFPFLTPEAHVRSYTEMWQTIYKNLPRWEFYTALDPGTASVFAGLCAAVNPYTGMVYIMDEVYALNQSETSIGKVWPQVAMRMKQIYDPDAELGDEAWHVCVDEAATWARTELLDQFGVASFPTSKAANKKPMGISLVKDLLLSGRLFISDRCTKLLWEMQGYMLDGQGNFIKRNDHLIDSLRYALAAANFTYQEKELPPRLEDPLKEPRRAYRPEDDMLDFGDNVEAYYDLEKV